MKTTVLGVRLNDIQREKLKAIGDSNKMTEGEVCRALVDSLISGNIEINSGKVINLSGLRELAKRHDKTLEQMIEMISEIE